MRENICTHIYFLKFYLLMKMSVFFSQKFILLLFINFFIMIDSLIYDLKK